MAKRSHHKKPEADAPAPAEGVEDTAELKPPDDGEAATDAETVPKPRGPRGPYKKRKGKTEAPEEKSSHQLSPALVKTAALGPMMLSAAIAAKFFDSMLIYDPTHLAECERMAQIWIEEMGLILHPGIQYAILASVAIGAGIKNSVPITKEVKDAMAKEMAAQKEMAAKQALANIEAAKQARESKNGPAPEPAASSEQPTANA